MKTEYTSIQACYLKEKIYVRDYFRTQASPCYSNKVVFQKFLEQPNIQEVFIPISEKVK